MQGVSVKAEIMGAEFFTVNSVVSLNNALKNDAMSSKIHNQAINANERHSVSRIFETKTAEPIRKQDERILWGSIKSHCTFCSATMTQNSANTLIEQKITAGKFRRGRNFSTRHPYTEKQ